METKIWVRKGYRNIKLNRAPREWRELRSFLIHNNCALNVVKVQGGYHTVSTDGILVFLCRCLTDLTFNDYYLASKIYANN